MTATLRQYGRTVRSYGGDHPIAVAIAERRPFRAGAMRGEVGGPWSFGRLPEPWLSRLDDADRENRVTFVIYSYATPIAWWVSRSDPRLVIPDEHYSSTTTRHQGYARAALPQS